MAPPVNVLSIATAVPPHQLDQRAIAVAAREVYARTFTRYPKLADVFVNAGIERRYSARPLEWLSKPHDWGERTEAYVEGASELFIQTAKAAAGTIECSARLSNPHRKRGSRLCRTADLSVNAATLANTGSRR